MTRIWMHFLKATFEGIFRIYTYQKKKTGARLFPQNVDLNLTCVTCEKLDIVRMSRECAKLNRYL